MRFAALPGIFGIERWSWEEHLVIDTLSGLKNIKLLLKEGEVEGVKVDMGRPVLESRMIPVQGPPRQKVINEPVVAGDKEFVFTAVNMGNPHCVIFVPTINNIPWQEWGAKIERDALFPQKVNVEFVEVESPREIWVNVWERGVGPTLACGTGACACVVAGVLTGKLERDVKVRWAFTGELVGERDSIFGRAGRRNLLRGNRAFIRRGGQVEK